MEQAKFSWRILQSAMCNEHPVLPVMIWRALALANWNMKLPTSCTSLPQGDKIVLVLCPIFDLFVMISCLFFIIIIIII